MSFHRTLSTTCLFVALSVLTGTFSASAVVYVSTTGSNTNGDSWTTAYTDVQAAVDDASLTGDSVWVAAGAYAISSAVMIYKSMGIYGGFPATGNPGFSQRNPAVFETVLDGQNMANHVIKMVFSPSVILDGLTIQGGSTKGLSREDGGGGICAVSNGMDTVTITNCHISGNHSENVGGGIYSDNCYVIVKDSRIEGNSSQDGGGINIDGFGAMIEISNTVIENNEATNKGGGVGCFQGFVRIGGGSRLSGNTAGYWGGALGFTEGYLTINDSEIIDNSAAQEGGGIKLHFTNYAEITNTTISGNSSSYLGGGIGSYSCQISLIKCLIYGNQSGTGGGVECHFSPALRITNSIIVKNTSTVKGGGVALDYVNGEINFCTIADNTSTGQGGGVALANGTADISASILWDNGPDQIFGTASVLLSDVQGIAAGNGNIDVDPLFLNPAAGNYHLRHNSPCIDVFQPPFAGSTDFDIDGEVRPFNYPNVGSEGPDFLYDMGADEVYTGPPAPPINPGATDISESNITWTWQDDSFDETGFKVWADPGTVAPVTLQMETAANTGSWQHSNLAANTLYSFQVASVNVYGESAKTALYSVWTLANVPLAPMVGGAALNTLAVGIASGDGNPPNTEYALQYVTLGKWVQADGTLGDAPVYRTAADWGTATVTGLASNTVHSFAVFARNGAGVVTAASPSASETTLQSVPNLVGLALDQAETTVTDAGLTVGTITTEYSDSVAAGSVISQNPNAGESVAPGSAINITTSLGPAPVTVPNVVGMTRAQAEQVLVAGQLITGAVAEEYNSTVPAGNVISQAPAGGSQVAPNSAVSLVVSLGPEPVTVPNVTGTPRTEAESAIVGAGLTVGAVTEQNDATVPAGSVISQTPAPGTPVLPGSAVSLVVSLGPAPTEDTARQALTEAFDQADTNGDGRLTYEEALAAIPGLTQAVFDALDTNQDGSLSLEELTNTASGCAGCSGCANGKSSSSGDLLLSLLGLAAMVGLSRP